MSGRITEMIGVGDIEKKEGGSFVSYTATHSLHDQFVHFFHALPISLGIFIRSFLSSLLATYVFLLSLTLCIRRESAIDFAQFLGEAPLPPPGPRARGGGTVRDPNGSMRVHPRNSHFGGLPPMDLGGGNAGAASGSRGSAMLSIDSLPQMEALQQATWRRRRRPRASEAFGQTALPPGGAAAAMQGGVADQFWEAARAHSG